MTSITPDASCVHSGFDVMCLWVTVLSLILSFGEICIFLQIGSMCLLDEKHKTQTYNERKNKSKDAGRFSQDD